MLLCMSLQALEVNERLNCVVEPYKEAEVRTLASMCVPVQASLDIHSAFYTLDIMIFIHPLIFEILFCSSELHKRHCIFLFTFINQLYNKSSILY